jgi:hypothetical protein
MMKGSRLYDLVDQLFVDTIIMMKEWMNLKHIIIP